MKHLLNFFANFVTGQIFKLLLNHRKSRNDIVTIHISLPLLYMQAVNFQKNSPSQMFNRILITGLTGY